MEYGWIASIIAAIIGAWSAKEQRQAAKSERKQSQAFSERMSSTAYQRGMADLRAGGLNPMLAGGRQASSPGGVQADIKEILGPSVSSAFAYKKQLAEVQNINATTRKTEAEKANIIQNMGIKLPTSQVMNEISGAITSAKGIKRNIQSRYKAHQLVRESEKRLTESERRLQKARTSKSRTYRRRNK